MASLNSIALATPLLGLRCRRSCGRRRHAAAVFDNHSSSGMPRVANKRLSLSGASPVAVPVPAPSLPRHGDGQAACTDTRHGRRPSPSSTGPTVAAEPPQARNAAKRPTYSWVERWPPISARTRGMGRCHKCRRCRFRLLDLGSGEADGRHGRRPSFSSKKSTVAAVLFQARIAASRPTTSGAKRHTHDDVGPSRG